MEVPEVWKGKLRVERRGPEGGVVEVEVERASGEV